MNASQPPRLPLIRTDDTPEAIFARTVPAAEVPGLFPTEKARRENKAIGLSAGDEPHLLNPAEPQPREGAVYLAYYVYVEGERHHNVTDWAVDQFRAYYVDVAICQSDILYYVYAMLHHPAYRPGDAIPLIDGFWKASDAGRSLTALHLIPGDPVEIMEETARIAASLADED